jgi:hypothetical protein
MDPESVRGHGHENHEVRRDPADRDLLKAHPKAISLKARIAATDSIEDIDRLQQIR